MRMQMRRFTRLTNAFSKKIENHAHALALYFFWYNWLILIAGLATPSPSLHVGNFNSMKGVRYERSYIFRD
jgi:hypothetical protein